MKATFTVLAAAAAVSFAVPNAAQAQLDPADQPESCGTVEILSEFNPDASACLGPFEGNAQQEIAGIIDAIADAGWGDATHVGSSDGNGPIDFDPEAGTGSITFNPTLTGDYVLALKSSTQFSLYRFLGLMNVGSIDYTMAGTAVNPNNYSPKGLSNVTLLSVGTVTVPEPEGWALMLTGLFALGFVARRRGRQAA